MTWRAEPGDPSDSTDPAGGAGGSAEEFAAAAAYRWERGSGGRSPVLMLHGLGGDAGQLWPVAGTDGRADRLAPDLRGHGCTGLVGDPADLTFPGMAADVAALLRRLHFGPAAVVGVSMGAGVAAALALREPAVVRSLLLIRPAWGETVPPPNLRPLLAVADCLRRYGAAGRGRFARTGTYTEVAARSPTAAASLLAQFDAADAARRSVRLARMPWSAPFRSYRELAGVTVPTLVVGAPRDPLHPLALAEQWAAAVPGAVLRTVPARDDDPIGHRARLAELAADFGS